MIKKILALALLSLVLTTNNNLTMSGQSVFYDDNSLYNEVKDGVVSLFNYFPNDKNNVSASMGTGIIFSSDENNLYILTNNHVTKDTIYLEVLFNNNMRYQGRLIGFDSIYDVAVVQVPKPDKYKILTLNNSDRLNPGEEIYSVGIPISDTLRFSFNKGMISKKGVELPQNSDFYQSRFYTHIDIPINPGNSGGPTFNMLGQVIGINTLKYVVDSSGNYLEGLNFMIPITDAYIIAKHIINNDNHKYMRKYIGAVEAYSLSEILLTYRNGYSIPETLKYGVIVDNLKNIDSNPLVKAGLGNGDIIAKIGDKKIDNTYDLFLFLRDVKIGSKVQIEYYKYATKYKLNTSTIDIYGIVY